MLFPCPDLPIHAIFKLKGKALSIKSIFCSFFPSSTPNTSPNSLCILQNLNTIGIILFSIILGSSLYFSTKNNLGSTCSYFSVSIFISLFEYSKVNININGTYCSESISFIFSTIIFIFGSNVLLTFRIRHSLKDISLLFSSAFIFLSSSKYVFICSDISILSKWSIFQYFMIF